MPCALVSKPHLCPATDCASHPAGTLLLRHRTSSTQRNRMLTFPDNARSRKSSFPVATPSLAPASMTGVPSRFACTRLSPFAPPAVRPRRPFLPLCTEADARRNETNGFHKTMFFPRREPSVSHVAADTSRHDAGRGLKPVRASVLIAPVKAAKGAASNQKEKAHDYHEHGNQHQSHQKAEPHRLQHPRARG